jgi:hypothetical protein
MERPNFSSQIPPALLEGVPDHTKWLMESVSKLSQASDWQTNELMRQSEKLGTIEDQCKKTNGRVNKIEEKSELYDEIAAKVKSHEAEMKEMLFLRKVLCNKYGQFALLSIMAVFSMACSYVYHNAPIISNILGKIFTVFS